MISPYPHLIDLNDYPVSWWKQVVDLGEQIKNHPEIYAGACSNKIMATLFYEPSTRTQMSFQTAMLRLGGRLIGFDNPANSSVSKGETLKDTTKIVSGYADILVMRHPVAGAAKAAALSADCPVINAGDSGHLHPTQTLTDLLTLQCEKGRLDHLTIGLCSDLINGGGGQSAGKAESAAQGQNLKGKKRTVHSLLKAMSCFEGNHFILISTPELGLPSYVKDILNASNCDFEEVSSLEEVLPKLDVLYMTRIQQERFASREEYLAQKDTYILTTKKMQVAKKDLVVLHPLPRVDEIEVALDEDPRAMYFKQAKYGMYVRMALIITMLNLDTHTTLLRGKTFPGAVCKNPNCITHTETYLPKH